MLSGTLTIPPDEGSLPAAVLITGLGAHNRNNGQPPWIPFRDLADAFTHRGIAVLRVDDRGVGASTGDHAPSTTFAEANDVRAGVAWLRTQPRIDRKRIALVGYSEGSFLSIDPLSHAQRVRCPALMIQGSTDLHVPVRSAQRLAAAIRGERP